MAKVSSQVQNRPATQPDKNEPKSLSLETCKYFESSSN